MTGLVFSEAQLLTEHDYARPQIVAGRRLHGGFLADGTYQPPRSKVRSPAIEAWTVALRDRGGDLLDADASLLTGPRVPNLAQHRLLLANGHGQTFWNQLTTTGKIEARGRALADLPVPDIGSAVVDDVDGWAVGHLDRGLLTAHGLDEGGGAENEIGGHDAMWFAARDLAFGPDAFEDVDPPERIGRPDPPDRQMPQVAREIEGLLSFLMNLLIIEFRAEIGFAVTQEVLRTDGLFPGREAQVAEAAEIIERIRADERVHVDSLRLYLGELRTTRFHTVDGSTIAGDELIDPTWDDLVRWATIDQPVIAARQQTDTIEDRLATYPESNRLVAEFRSLSDYVPTP